MEFFETIRLAVSAIWVHKLRSALTLLGMIIGVTAVVIVVSLIQGFNRYVDEKIAGIGAKSFSIRRFSFDDWKNTDTIAEAQRRNKDLTFDDFDYIRERATLIDKFGAKALQSPANLKRGSESMERVSVDGATPNIAEIENTDIAEGRYFIGPENDSASAVAFLGAEVATKLFPGRSALNQEISINGLPYRVVGIAAAKGTIFGMPQDIFVTVPINTYAKNFGSLVRQRSLYFVGTSRSDEFFQDAVDEARALMRTRRQLHYGEKDSFGIMTPDAITGLRDRIFGPIFVVAIAVPSIALVVGGIVIMNIMLGVSHRTHKRDRNSQKPRRAPKRHPQTVPHRSGDAFGDWRYCWGDSRLACGPPRDGSFLSDLPFVDCSCCCRHGFGRSRGCFGNLAGEACSLARSD